MTLGLEQLYEDLNKVYTDVVQRRSFLSERAGTLVGFDGVAAAILAGVVGGFRNTRSPIIAILVIVALLLHAGSAVSAIAAIYEHPWYVAPSLPRPREKSIQEFFADPSKISWAGLALQIDKAIELNEKENWRKYHWLSVGYKLLALAVCVSVLIGLVTVLIPFVFDP